MNPQTASCHSSHIRGAPLKSSPVPADNARSRTEWELPTVLMITCFLIGLLTVPLLGGRLRALADTRLHRARWLGAALVVQIVVVSVLPNLPVLLAAALHIASYALAGVFLWSNRTITGLWLVALGTASNSLAILANGGVMPASRAALERAGLLNLGAQFENSAVVPNARIAFLGDIFAVPDNIPFANVFSIGDIAIVIGALVAVHQLCRRRATRQPTNELRSIRTPQRVS